MNKSFTQADLAQQINNVRETKLDLILYLGFFHVIAAHTTILLFMANSTAFLTTISFLKEKEIMTRASVTSNTKTAGLIKIKGQMSQMLSPLPKCQRTS